MEHSAKKFQPGDVVKLKGQDFLMTMSLDPDTGELISLWFFGCHLNQQTFRFDELELVRSKEVKELA